MRYNPWSCEEGEVFVVVVDEPLRFRELVGVEQRKIANRWGARVC